MYNIFIHMSVYKKSDYVHNITKSKIDSNHYQKHFQNHLKNQIFYYVSECEASRAVFSRRGKVAYIHICIQHGLVHYRVDPKIHQIGLKNATKIAKRERRGGMEGGGGCRPLSEGEGVVGVCRRIDSSAVNLRWFLMWRIGVQRRSPRGEVRGVAWRGWQVAGRPRVKRTGSSDDTALRPPPSPPPHLVFPSPGCKSTLQTGWVCCLTTAFDGATSKSNKVTEPEPDARAGPGLTTL